MIFQCQILVKIVFDNQIKEQNTIGLIDYLTNSFSVSNILYDINKTSYKENQELIEKLEKVSIEQALQEITENDIEEQLSLEGQEQNKLIFSQLLPPYFL